MKKLQLETTKIESDFYKEVQELEGKYQALYQPLFDKRTQIVKGRNLTLSGMYILHGTPCQKGGGGVLKIFGDAKIILLCSAEPNRRKLKISECILYIEGEGGGIKNSSGTKKNLVQNLSELC